VTRPFNVLKLARAEIGSLQAEPAAWLRYGSSDPGLEIPSRRDGFVSGDPSPGSGAKTLGAADHRIDHVWLRCHTT
jgi:hypothetical protein